VEQVLHPVHALDRAARPNELLDLPVALELTAQVDDGVVGVDAHLALGDARRAKGDALDLLGERDIVGWLLVSTDARYGMRGLVGDALGDALEVLRAAHGVARAAPQHGAGAILQRVSAARAVLAVEEEVLGQRAYAAGRE
jgi:hypothetical protein